MRKMSPAGLSFEQVARMAIDNGIYITCACNQIDVGAVPPIVTIQIVDASKKVPVVNFRYELKEPLANLNLCLLLEQKVQEVVSKRGPLLHKV